MVTTCIIIQLDYMVPRTFRLIIIIQLDSMRKWSYMCFWKWEIEKSDALSTQSEIRVLNKYPIVLELKWFNLQNVPQQDRYFFSLAVFRGRLTKIAISSFDLESVETNIHTKRRMRRGKKNQMWPKIINLILKRDVILSNH